MNCRRKQHHTFVPRCSSVRQERRVFGIPRSHPRCIIQPRTSLASYLVLGYDYSISWQKDLGDGPPQCPAPAVGPRIPGGIPHIRPESDPAPDPSPLPSANGRNPQNWEETPVNEISEAPTRQIATILAVPAISKLKGEGSVGPMPLSIVEDSEPTSPMPESLPVARQMPLKGPHSRVQEDGVQPL